jgi:hypothetical protein
MPAPIIPAPMTPTFESSVFVAFGLICLGRIVDKQEGSPDYILVSLLNKVSQNT